MDEGMPYVSVAAAANMLHVSKQRVYQLLQSGSLAERWTGGTRLVGVQSIKQRLRAQDERKHLRLEI